MTSSYVTNLLPIVLRPSRRRDVDVTLRTVEAVRRLLERSPLPVSRNWLLARLSAASRTTTRQRLNRALSFFFDLGLAIEGTKGVQWTHSDSESLRQAVATGRQL